MFNGHAIGCKYCSIYIKTLIGQVGGGQDSRVVIRGASVYTVACVYLPVYTIVMYSSDIVTIVDVNMACQSVCLYHVISGHLLLLLYCTDTDTLYGGRDMHVTSRLYTAHAYH